MTPERFETLAEAWGGDVARWPVADRDAAAQFMAADPGRAQAILAAAAELDAVLTAYAAPRATGALAERIAASAPRPRPRWRAWLVPSGMGAGLAAACAAGMLLGVHLGVPATTTIENNEPIVTAVSDDAVGFYLDEEAG